MTRNQEQPITLTDFVQEAIARQLSIASKTVPFPPVMLEKMTRADLAK